MPLIFLRLRLFKERVSSSNLISEDEWIGENAHSVCYLRGEKKINQALLQRLGGNLLQEIDFFSEGKHSLNVLSNLRWNVLPNWNYPSPFKSLPLGSVGRISRRCEGYEANHKSKPWNTAVLKQVWKKNRETDASFNGAS